MNSEQKNKAPPSSSTKFTIRAPPANNNKKYSVIQFQNTDLSKFTEAKIHRENNVKSHKLIHNIDQMPKFGSGSEYGREARDEARRKKFGVRTKKYILDDQPYMLNLSKGKEDVKKFKSQQVGSIQTNANYYIFTQLNDGSFQIMPVDQYHKFTPVSTYKKLDPEEAEEQFEKRNKTMNYFSIMLQKKISGEDKELNDDELDDNNKSAGGKKKKSAKQQAEEGRKQDRKNFMLTEMDGWVANDSDLSSPPESDDGAENPKKSKGKKKSKAKKRKKKKENSDEEALEESDEFDEGKEVDYMTSSDSNDEVMYSDKQRDNDKYTEKGVEDEAGSRRFNESDESSEEDENAKKDKEKQKNGIDNSQDVNKQSASSDSSESDSDSDIEKNLQFTSSALLMQNRQVPDDANSSEDDLKDVEPAISPRLAKKRKYRGTPDKANSSKRVEPSPGGINVNPNTTSGTIVAAIKRRCIQNPTSTPHRSTGHHQGRSSPMPTSSSSSSSAMAAATAAGGAGSSGAAGQSGQPMANDHDRTLITPDSISRYLMRKPMTTTELIQKFKSKNTGLKNQELVNTIVQTLKLVSYKMMTTKENKLLLYVKDDGDKTSEAPSTSSK